MHSLVYLFFSLLFSCSTVQLINYDTLYSEDFLAKVEGIESIYRDGDASSAKNRLALLYDDNLNQAEKAKKYNLLGLIDFSQLNYNKSIENFSTAASYVGADKVLQAQIYLNLASSYYKINDYDNSFSNLHMVQYDFLREKEQEQYHALIYIVGNVLEKSRDVVNSAVYLLKDAKTFSEVEGSKYKTVLLENFRKLSRSERSDVLVSNEDRGYAVIALLAKEEVFRRYFEGNRSDAKDVIAWLRSSYRNNKEITKFVDDFNFRIENYSKVDTKSIGVVLPLSSRDSSERKLAREALEGIETSLSQLDAKDLKVFVKDTKGSPLVATQMIDELIRKNHVSIIIGGVSAESVVKEFKSTKKYGVVFISLKNVDIPKKEKSHLLLEIPGSIQSQLKLLFGQKSLEKFGSRISIMYPESDKGEVIVDDVWTNYKGRLVDVTSVSSYKEGLTDYRDNVANLLGLQFKRERKEELEAWEEVYSLQKKGSIRRTQTLRPVIDFDWVFLPAEVDEAIYIVSTFNIFDANKVVFIGGPQWLSKKLVTEQSKSLRSPMFLVASKPSLDKEFIKYYIKRNKRKPHLVEILGYEALHLASQLVNEGAIDSRDSLEASLLKSKSVKGITGEWYLEDRIWIKKMDLFRIRNKKVLKYDLSSENS